MQDVAPYTQEHIMETDAYKNLAQHLDKLPAIWGTQYEIIIWTFSCRAPQRMLWECTNSE